MRKNVRKTVYTCALSAFACFATAAAFSAVNTHSATAELASASIRFISPDSYEEYLALSAPNATAVCADYTAIADANRIYIYDKARQTYSTFTYLDKDGKPQTVKNLQFCENGNLYFAVDAPGDNFYQLTPRDKTATKIPDIACEKFVIDGTDLYFANAAGTLHTVSLKNGGSPKKLLSDAYPNPTEPILAFWKGELYFTDNGVTQRLFKVSPTVGIPTPVADFSVRAQSITINAGILAHTTFSGDFYAYELNNVTENAHITHVENGEFSALYSCGDHIYATQKNVGAVKQYSITDKAFTDHEIASSSSSVNRLNGAVYSELCGDLLFTADNGNDRISVYDTKNDAFLSPIATDLDPTYLSASENTLLIANNDKAELYDVSSFYAKNTVDPIPAPTLLQTFENFQGEITGLAGVYGTYYLITPGYAYSIGENEETHEWERTETKKGCTSFVSPTLFTADVYGDLYVATGNFVYKFNEEEFMQTDVNGREICSTLPSVSTKIALDYACSLYALADNTIYRFSQNTETFDLSSPHVYADSVQITSFAFGVEENHTYLLCDQNYIVQTDILSLPTVKTIAVNDADQEIFSKNSATFTVVETKENALSIRFDIEKLQGASVFPYLSYQRKKTPFTALEIGKVNEYSILAYYDVFSHEYKTYLVKTEDCTSLPDDTYQKTYTKDEQSTGYLTNALPLYKLPYLTDLLTVRTLERGEEVTLLGEIAKLDHEYYQISYTDETGAVQTGYIPKAYVTPFNGTPPTTEIIVLGDTESETDSVWRLGYIVLGLTAIGILSDWLILRKKDDENDKENSLHA